MHSNYIIRRKEREVWTASDPESLSGWVQSHTAVVKNVSYSTIKECAKRLPKVSVMQQNHKAPNESRPVTTKSMAARLSSQKEVPAILCNAIHS